MKNGFQIKQGKHAMVFQIKDWIHHILNIMENLKKLRGMRFSR